MKRISAVVLVALVLGLAGLAAACGDDDDNGDLVPGDGVATPSQGGAEDGGTVLEIAAENAEEFTEDELTASAGTVTVQLDNRDDGVAHNWALYPSADDITQQIAATEIVIGPDTAEVTFDVEAGEYFFRCDPHPNMTGTFIAE